MVVEGNISLDQLNSVKKILGAAIRCEEFQRYVPQVKSPTDRNFKKLLQLILEALSAT